MFKKLLRTVPVSGYRTRTRVPGTALNLAGGHPLLAVLQELSKNPTQPSRKVRNLLSEFDSNSMNRPVNMSNMG